jgi:uncharacterized Zn-binding protein involved in type VI secretion
MPGVFRMGDMTNGHGYFPVPLLSGVTNVVVNGIPVGVIGGAYPPHTMGDSVHAGTQGAGSTTVVAGGLGIARMGDPLTCGDTCGAGSSNVIAN